jgi:hypothetical protein
VYGVKRLLPAALCHALAAAPAVAQDPAQQPVRHEEGILEIVADRLPPLTAIVLLDSAGRVLIPVRATLHHLGFAPLVTAQQFELPSLGGLRLVFDARAGIIISGTDTTQLAPAEYSVRAEDVYLRAERFAALVEAESSFDAAALSLAFTRRIPFPAQQRIIAEQRRAMLLARQQRRDDAANGSIPYPAYVGGGVVDWELATLGLDPSSRSTARLRGGIAVLGGDLAAGGTFELGRDAVDLVQDVTLRYHRVFPHSAYLTQLRAGNIITSGIFARFVRGLEITNRAYLQDHELGEVLLRPDLPLGWEYEVLQGNQLLGYSGPGARDGISIPLRTGTTPVQVRMLGPAGEEVVTTLLYQMPVSMLGRGRVEYAAAFGRCEGLTCTRYGHADIRYGATSQLTVGVGVEHVTDTLASATRGYALASFSTGTRWTGEVQLMPRALYAASIAHYPRDGSVARFRASRSRPGFGPVSIIPAELARWDTEFSWDERLEPGVSAFGGRVLPFTGARFSYGAAGSAAHGLQRMRVAVTATHHRGHAELRYDYERASARPSTVSARTALLLPVAFRGTTLRPMINATAGIGSIGVRLLEAGFSVQPRNHYVLSAGIAWSRELRTPALSIGWTARLGPVQASVRGVTGRTGASTAASLSGSTAINHFGQVTTRASALTGYAGLHGIVFIDHDGNGVLSGGDERVPGVALVAGGVPLTADAHGRYAVWGLQPYTVAAVAIDSVRIPDPSWTTTAYALRVRPAPNAARRVDIALVRTRELIGSVIAAPGVATAGGIAITITSLDTGTTTAARTFSDGQFYISRIRPGRYRLEVATASLEALGARARTPAIDFTVPAAGNDIVIEIPPIHLDPAG